MINVKNLVRSAPVIVDVNHMLETYLTALLLEYLVEFEMDLMIYERKSRFSKWTHFCKLKNNPFFFFIFFADYKQEKPLFCWNLFCIPFIVEPYITYSF